MLLVKIGLAPFLRGGGGVDSLLAARIQMEVSLAFHMIFAAFGIGLPLFMLIAEWRWLKTGQRHYLRLAKQWGNATVVLFAIGAVSGTALAFELGLLWPAFMEFAGGVIGPAFTLEAFAFFLEAIFIALYLFGWERLPGWIHWWTGVPVALSGAASSVLVVATNSWMQNPIGLDRVLANPESVRPLELLFGNPMWRMMALHSTLAAYVAATFALAGVYAYVVLRGNGEQPGARSALRMTMAVGFIVAALMPITGHAYTKVVGDIQPAKLAAMEGLFVTQQNAPLTVGGWPDMGAEQVRFGVPLPGMLSWMLHGRTDAEVIGLDQFDRELWPHVPITRTAFQLMVGSGFLMIAVAAWFWLVAWRSGERFLQKRGLMRAVLIASPLGFVGLQTGWIVTEVGRQPWVVYNFMRTADALNRTANMSASLFGFSLLYVLLTVALIWLLLRLAGGEEKGLADGDGGGRGTEHRGSGRQGTEQRGTGIGTERGDAT